MSKTFKPEDFMHLAPKPEGHKALSKQEIHELYAEKYPDLPPIGQVTPVSAIPTDSVE